MPNIVVIGAGSAIFGTGALATLLRSSKLKGATLGLCDLNAETLATMHRLAERMNAEWAAGMTIRAPLDEFADADWHRIMKTNLDSAYYVGQAVARKMLPRKRGKIINICSVQSELGRPGTAPYMASKGAMKMLTKGMAVDWGPHGLQVNGLGPGYFKTELTQALVDDATFSAWLVGRTPSRRWGDVEDLGPAIVFLASEASRFVNGHILYVDGGITATL